MAKNRWYHPREDAFLVRRARQLGIAQQPYGRRAALYRRLARELEQWFGVRRSWQGVQQRVRWLLSSARPAGG